MHIAMVAPVDEAVPPITYGGTEIVVANLIEELVRLGHQVTLFATGGSHTQAKLYELFPEPARSMPLAKNDRAREALRIVGVGKALEQLASEQFDVVHNHTGWRMLPFTALVKAPVVTTIHTTFVNNFEADLYAMYRDANYISISLNQRKPRPELNYVANVYNGIRAQDFVFQPRAQETEPYFAFLARMSPEKGPLEAIQIAKKAGVKLIMATKIDPVDQEFYETKIKQHIDGKQIMNIGEIGPREKTAFLGGARALLAPIQWEEPFGLFFVEAMLSGTPVIAMRRGSTSELIQDGVTGFLCETVDEAVAKIPQVDGLDRRACYDHALANFSAKKMAQDYVAAYEKVIK